ncbi:DUF1822 family protein [Phormidesmis priestleyi]
MLSLDDLVTLYPNETWLELSQFDQHTIREQVAAQRYSSPNARDRAYQNLLCLQAVTALLMEDFELSDCPNTWLEESDLPSVWDVVNGSAIEINQSRLAIIPCDDTNFEELRVEQEWVDIPTWAAHYYLAVQINTEDGWLRVLGYATHQQLKQANHDPLECTYSLDRERLRKDIHALSLVKDWFPPQRLITEPLPFLSDRAIAAWIKQLSQTTLYSPRLDVPFEQWAALVSDCEWRKVLYEQRSRPLETYPKNKLSQWADSIFEPGWQAVTELLDTSYALARGTQQRAKPVPLGNHTVALIVTREPIETPDRPKLNSEISILLEAKVMGEDAPLCANLRLSVLFHNESGQDDTIEQQIPANSFRSAIQLPRLLGKPGEEFSVTLTLGAFSFTEAFVV